MLRILENNRFLHFAWRELRNDGLKWQYLLKLLMMILEKFFYFQVGAFVERDDCSTGFFKDQRSNRFYKL